MKIIVLVSLAVAIALASAVPQPKVDTEWWKTAVFYQVYPRSFKDSDDSGEGDLRGIMDKIDHFVEAGITAIWLSPIYQSPQVDSGYDISNFREIDTKYGSMIEFMKLVTLAKEKGLKIVMDFVPNHSSDKHDWFIASATGTDGPYKDFYVWQDGKGVNKRDPPNNWLSIWGGSAWEYVPARNQFYLHQFSKQQPDLNYENPAVLAEMTATLEFWLNLGVDGFRIDAIPHLCEDTEFKDEPFLAGPFLAGPFDWNSLDHIYTKDQPKTYDVVKIWRKAVDAYAIKNGRDTIVLMTEAYTTLAKTMEYYGTAAEPGAHFSFNFQLITGANIANKAKGIVDEINNWATAMIPGTVANWVIGNHDNHRVATRFGTENVDGMNMVVMVLPGVGVTYNGEEIGMEDGDVLPTECQDPSVCPDPGNPGSIEDFEENGRDFERTPFHWDATTNAGFNTGEKPWLPVSDKYEANNLADQMDEAKPKSHFSIYRALTKEIRPKLKSYPQCVAKTYNEDVVLIERGDDDNSIILAFNTGTEEYTINVQSTFDVEEDCTILLSSGASDYAINAKGTSNSLKLKGHDAVIFSVKKNGAAVAQISVLLLSFVALLKMFV